MIKWVKPKVIFIEKELVHKVKHIIEELKSNAKIYIFGPQSYGYQSVNDLLKPTGKELEFKTPLIHDLIHTTAIIICSSGTTGLNKGTRLSHAHFSENILR